jgi:hypothetical protein
MADLGATFDAGLGDDFISAVDELRARDQWVAWRLLTRPGASKPTKPPVNPNTGGPASHSDPRTWSSYARAEARAKRDSLAGVGFVLTDDDDYTGIDLDKCRDPATGEIEPWAQAIIDMAETYAEVSPSGTGIRMIARGKIDKAVKSDVAHVEIYVSQRYLTITEQHIEGTPNEIREAPKTLAALIARAESMRPKREEPQPSPIPPRPSSAPRGNETRERAWASKALEGVTSELASQGEGGRNHALNAAAYRLGRLVARGWLARAEAIASLEDACRANGLWKDDGPKGVRATLMSGLRSGLAQPHEDLPESEYGNDAEAEALGDKIATKLVQMDDGTVINEETGEIAESHSTPKDGAGKRIDTDDFPDHLTYVPGFLGDLVEYLNDTAVRPRRAFSLMSAVAMLGTMTGRHWCGPTYSPTHLYTVFLAPSGSGKDHYIRAPRKILEDTKIDVVGESNFMSQGAVYGLLHDRPCSLSMMDEIGDTIQKMSGKRAASHETGMAQTLKELWGMGFVHGSAPGYAGRRGEKFFAPALSILGLSTHERFWGSFETGAKADGFLNRFLIFSFNDRPEKQKPKIAIYETDTPDWIINGLYALHAGGVESYKDMKSVAGPLHWDSKPKPVRVPWETPEVEAIHDSHVEAIATKYEDDEERAAFYARTAENAVRLATIRALGARPRDPAVSADDMRWGIEVSEWATKQLMIGAGEYMSETEFQKNAQHVVRIIRAYGGKCSEGMIAKRINNKLKSKELKDVLQTMLDSDTIVEIEAVKIPKRGKKAKWYRLSESLD